MPSAPPMLAKILSILRTILEAVIRIPARVFGSRNQRLLKQYSHAVESINALEAGLAALSDEALRARTEELRKRHAEGATLDELLPDAFAVVREASKRTLRMRHFDVQLLGGMVLHNGKIAEVGSTGRSTGPHLHFEVRFRGVAQNPGKFLVSNSQSAVARAK